VAVQNCPHPVQRVKVGLGHHSIQRCPNRQVPRQVRRILFHSQVKCALMEQAVCKCLLVTEFLCWASWERSDITLFVRWRLAGKHVLVGPLEVLSVPLNMVNFKMSLLCMDVARIRTRVGVCIRMKARVAPKSCGLGSACCCHRVSRGT